MIVHLTAEYMGAFPQELVDLTERTKGFRYSQVVCSDESSFIKYCWNYVEVYALQLLYR